MAKSKYTQEQVRQFQAYAEAGESIIKSATLSGLTKSQGYNIAKKLNIKFREARGSGQNKQYFPCIICGISFHTKKYQYDNNIRKTCSKKCSSIYRSKYKISEKREEIEALIKKGFRFFEIAKELAINKKSLEYYLNTWKLKAVKPVIARLTPEQKIELPNLYLSGIKANALARKYKVGVREVYRCLKESNILIRRRGELTDSEVASRLNSGMEILERRSKFILVRCKIHPEEVYSRQAADIGGGCLICGNNSTSSGEQELFDEIQKMNAQAQHRVKIPGSRQEVDIFIPDLNIGIEYNGLYWHSEAIKQNRKFHKEKLDLCSSKGLTLYNIFEHEWVERKKQVLSYLESKVAAPKRKIFARHCTVKVFIDEEDLDKAKDLIESTHIQGYAASKFIIGLEYKNELIGVCTFNRHHRGGQNNTIFLKRLCFKSGVAVIGGTERMVAYAKRFFKEKGYKKMATWSDNRYSEGLVYKRAGFNLVSELDVDYFYFKSSKVFSKQSLKAYTHSELISMGYGRVWDCGKKKWELDL